MYIMCLSSFSNILQLTMRLICNFFKRLILTMCFFFYESLCCCCLMAQSYLTVCDSVHGISQKRILEWVAISFSRGSSQTRDRTCGSCQVSCIAGGFFYCWVTGKAQSPWKFVAFVNCFRQEFEDEGQVSYALYSYSSKNHAKYFKWIMHNIASGPGLNQDLPLKQLQSVSSCSSASLEMENYDTHGRFYLPCLLWNI